MPITDKTRKILWGRSGNRCAKCKRELVIEATPTDTDSVVGEECHIISPHKGGPRYDETLSKQQIDNYENLILLCRTHHKLIDDQYESYTCYKVREMKKNHEQWVSEQLSNDQKIKPIKFRRAQKDTPSYLIRLKTGQQILNLILNSHMLLPVNDEPKTQNEVDIIGDFYQTCQDLADLSSDLEPKQIISAAFALTQMIEELELAGFWVFGAKEIQMIEGGNLEPANWNVAHISLVRKDNDAIMRPIIDDTTTPQKKD